MDNKQHIAIFTTASLPWMTGTAVNPLFRAAYLAKNGQAIVTLVLPWLSLKDQHLVYPSNITFNSPKEQEYHIRQWLEERTGFASGFEICFYPGKVIRLSAATQELPRSIVCNVHGVNPKFLDIGWKVQEQQQQGCQTFTKGAYYIGKMVWSKGYKELLQLLSKNQEQLAGFQLDLYGSGEDSEEVKHAAKKLRLTVNVYPGRDHADPQFLGYKVFINPSTTDVVCTTTAEALAMGKVVVCANHPSNEFFKQFPNCRTYEDEAGFVNQVHEALSSNPAPLTSEQQHVLSWEAATARFLRVAELNTAYGKIVAAPSYRSRSRFMSLTATLPNIKKYMEDASAFIHFAASGIEATRRAFGAIPGSMQPDEEQCRELGLPFPQLRH
ncbi:digalactosyldiacylglycerol synthase 2, chloroplastic isoform X2 [Nymphaea colorata]|uniref:digalactosyldiacylglycerol synthase 2, chloroplastic isoform X2 n=1 Tax=Nymphaea colorata TaxID=210225 RepID=UPI00129D3CE2|nr:digalactosyldiacylglycerol synthase 2, chloroplastic isoform X2 [Nymphaea colorata]